jgi:uncharacterized protein (UPF0248 family)
MFVEKLYDRKKVYAYAYKWAYLRNPRYLDFTEIGGDCTNFCSQCIYAGCTVMNYTPVYGWYYNNAKSRSASWTSVEYLYKFLINNKGQGPYAKKVEIENIMIGDIIQLIDEKNIPYHSLVVVQTGELPSIDNTFVSTHSFNAFMRGLNTYSYADIRCLHIEGARVYKK